MAGPMAFRSLHVILCKSLPYTYFSFSLQLKKTRYLRLLIDRNIPFITVDYSVCVSYIDFVITSRHQHLLNFIFSDLFGFTLTEGESQGTFLDVVSVGN